MQLSVDDKIIVWPGRKSEKPEGFMIPTHLKVLTIEEKPFVYVRKLEGPGTCEADEIPCPHYNETHAGRSIHKLYTSFLLHSGDSYSKILLQRLLHGSFK